jgi:hypothetical protein
MLTQARQLVQTLLSRSGNVFPGRSVLRFGADERFFCEELMKT